MIMITIIASSRIFHSKNLQHFWWKIWVLAARDVRVVLSTLKNTHIRRSVCLKKGEMPTLMVPSGKLT